MRQQFCFYCERTEGPFHKDHVVPRSRGGPDTPFNLVDACEKCNSEKSDLLPSEWLAIVPHRILMIEKRIVASVQVRIRSKREWKKRSNLMTPASDLENVCFFCAGRFTSAEETFLEFYDEELGPPFKHSKHTWVRFLRNGGREERGRLVYPGNFRWEEDVASASLAAFTHQKCGPDTGHHFRLDRLVDEEEVHGRHGLRRHVQEKVWWSPVLDEALVEGHKLALRLNQR